MKIALHASCHPGKSLFLKDLRLSSCVDLTKWSKVDHSASPCGCAVRARGALRRPALEGFAELLYGLRPAAMGPQRLYASLRSGQSDGVCAMLICLRTKNHSRVASRAPPREQQ